MVDEKQAVLGPEIALQAESSAEGLTLSANHYWGFAKRALRAALLGHLLFLVLFYQIGANLLVAVNLGSIAVYAVCIWLVDHKRYTAIMLLVRIELLVHAALASWTVGWDSGFHYYALLPPLLLFINERRIAVPTLAHATLLIILYIALDAWLSQRPPQQVVNAQVLQAVRYFNIASYLGTMAYLIYLYSTAVMAAEQCLSRMATTDTLTGLKNRRRIIEIAEYEENRNKRSCRPFAVIIADLDNFKTINDTYGHACGDRVLKQVAQILRDCVRPEDCVGRWGGEEFVMLLPETAIEDAARVGERIRQAVAALKIFCGTTQVPVTITLGVSECGMDENFDQCVARADAALYRGKSGGRNRTEMAQ